MSFRFVTIYYEMLQQQQQQKQQQESVLYEEVGNYSSTVVSGETENPTIVTIPVADGHP